MKGNVLTEFARRAGPKKLSAGAIAVILLGAVLVLFAGETPVERCDRLAGDPADPQSEVSGVPKQAIDVSAAVKACEAAVAEAPENPRMRYQLARAWLAGLRKGKDVPTAELVDQLRTASDQGYTAATARYGSMRMQGIIVEQDIAEATELLEQTAAEGSPVAQNNLAILLQDERFIEKDTERALQLYRRSAEAGITAAKTNLGRLYRHGIGVDKDIDRAVKLLQEASEAGEPGAKVMLAEMRLSGQYLPHKPDLIADLLLDARMSGKPGIDRMIAPLCDRFAAHPYDARADAPGVPWNNLAGDAMLTACAAAVNVTPKNLRRRFQAARARYWNEREGTLTLDRSVDEMRAVAEAGYPIAMAVLGEMLLFHPDHERQPEAARRWFKKAADAGSILGKYNLAWAYETGTGGTRWPETAADLYREAIEADYPRALVRLGNMLRSPDSGIAMDKTEAAKLMRRAAQSGYVYAMAVYADMVYQGDGVSRDREAAARWYAKAAEHGNAAAQYNYGLMIENGEGGLTKDMTAAVKWYRKAAQQDHTPAQTKLGKALYEGGGVEPDPETAVTWLRKAMESGNNTATQLMARAYRQGRGVSQNRDRATQLELSASGPASAVLNEAWERPGFYDNLVPAYMVFLYSSNALSTIRDRCPSIAPDSAPERFLKIATLLASSLDLFFGGVQRDDEVEDAAKSVFGRTIGLAMLSGMGSRHGKAAANMGCDSQFTRAFGLKARRAVLRTGPKIVQRVCKKPTGVFTLTCLAMGSMPD